MAPARVTPAAPAPAVAQDTPTADRRAPARRTAAKAQTPAESTTAAGIGPGSVHIHATDAYEQQERESHICFTRLNSGSVDEQSVISFARPDDDEDFAEPSPDAPKEAPSTDQLIQHYVRVAIVVLGLVLVDQTIAQLLKMGGIAFPSAVIGLVVMSVVLFYMNDKHHVFFETKFQPFMKPGVTFLSSWMSLFFIVLLVPLPGRDLPSASDAFKMMVVLVAGWVFTFALGAGIPLFLRVTVSRWRYPHKAITPTAANESVKAVMNKDALKYWSKWATVFAVVNGVTFAAGFLISGIEEEDALGVVTVINHMSATLMVFIVCVRILPKKVQTVLPPAFLAMAGISALVGLYGIVVGDLWDGTRAGIGAYMSGSMLNSPKAGDVFVLGLGPSVMVIAFKLLDSQDRVRHCMWKIVIAVVVNTITSAVFNAAVSGALGLRSDYGMALLPRFITAPIAVGIADVTGASQALTASFTILSGTFGMAFGRPLLALFSIYNPVARGVAMGSASHGLGTAKLTEEKESEAAAIAGVSFAAVGTFGAILFSIQGFTDGLLDML
eukprot:GFYU01001493.1.p1 GENE.GFYU01001493.1~~GFYU01001493.1.p1  ORF type:complete len:606 (+),score=164.42 GFYU01001493.1:158-1819(+)